MNPAFRPQRRYLFLLSLTAATALFLGWVLLTVWTLSKANPAGYSSDHYLAFGGSSRIPFSYEHARIWLGRDADIVASMKRADVLFTGPSSTQFAFSHNNVDRWFAQHGERVYLLGFSYFESNEFAMDLVRRFELHPRLVVVNSDHAFQNLTSNMAKRTAGMQPVTWINYALTTWLQEQFKSLCTASSLKGTRLCRGQSGIFRSRSTGAWISYLPSSESFALSPDPVEKAALPKGEMIANARKMRDELRARGSCMVIVTTPRDHIDAAAGETIARAIGVPFLKASAQGLRTMDHNHLEEASARQWSSAILDQLPPILQHCTGNRT